LKGLSFALEVDPVVEDAVGSPLPGTHTQLVDDDGNDVGFNTPDELKIFFIRFY
jgi:hypothetical protein